MRKITIKKYNKSEILCRFTPNITYGFINYLNGFTADRNIHFGKTTSPIFPDSPAETLIGILKYYKSISI